MYIRTLVFDLFGNHKLKKVYKNKMFYGDFSNWSLPLSVCFSGLRARGPSSGLQAPCSGRGPRAGPHPPPPSCQIPGHS